jgi:hypothetical protein
LIIAGGDIKLKVVLVAIFSKQDALKQARNAVPVKVLLFCLEKIT